MANYKRSTSAAEVYRRKITETVAQIKNPNILVKIYIVAKTHLEILRKKEQED